MLMNFVVGFAAGYMMMAGLTKEDYPLFVVGVILAFVAVFGVFQK
jgi:hypothetical protein